MIAQDTTFQSAVPDEASIGNAGHGSAPNGPWQNRFLRLLPAIRRYAEIRFRGIVAMVANKSAGNQSGKVISTHHSKRGCLI